MLIGFARCAVKFHTHIAAAIYITAFDPLVNGPCMPVATYDSLGLHTQLRVAV